MEYRSACLCANSHFRVYFQKQKQIYNLHKANEIPSFKVCMCNRVVDWPILLTFMHFNLLHNVREHRFCTQSFDAMFDGLSLSM